MAKKSIPSFASEKEESEWFYQHRDELEQYMDEPTEADQTEFEKELTAIRASNQPQSKNISINMPLRTIERAKRLAERKGIGYQTLIKMLIHEALEKEESA